MTQIVTERPEEITKFAVDADIIAYRCASVCEGAPDSSFVLSTIDDFINHMVEHTGVKDLAIFLSGKTKDCFRYKLATTRVYKGNRAHIQRPQWIDSAKSYLMTNYKGYMDSDYEADDLIASYMTQYEGTAHAGIDKDIWQVEGWHYDFVKHQWQFTNWDTSQLLKYRQIAMGDTTDNIPGLPRIGKVASTKAITDPVKAFDDCFELYKTVCRNKLQMNEQQAQAYFSEQSMLVTMVETVEIPEDILITVEPPSAFDALEDGWESVVSKVGVDI